MPLRLTFRCRTEQIVRASQQVIEWRGKPRSIRCDNGPEYISHKLDAWADKQAVKLEFIQPVKPQQNAYVERFNRIVRYDRLNHFIFLEIEEVQTEATKWMWTYNNERHNMAIGGITPRQKLSRAMARDNLKSKTRKILL